MQASDGHELDPESKAKDPPERKISMHEKKISSTERKISSTERKKRSTERKLGTTERILGTSESKTCASITVPSMHQRPVQEHHLRYPEQQQQRYPEQQHQDIDERLSPDYDDKLEKEQIDFCTNQKREEHNRINFREESYQEYVNNFPDEQFCLEDRGSYDNRYTIEKLPRGQLQGTSGNSGQLQVKQLYASNQF